MRCIFIAFGVVVLGVAGVAGAALVESHNTAPVVISPAASAKSTPTPVKPILLEDLD